MITDAQLLELKGKVESAKNNVVKLEGQLEMLNKQLHDTWGCKTLEQAEKKFAQMEKEIESKDKAIAVGKQELEEKYGEFLNG